MTRTAVLVLAALGVAALGVLGVVRSEPDWYQRLRYPLRYEAIVTAATSAQVAFDSLNSDLHDNELFLKHDFNAASVHSIAAQVEVLAAQIDELDQRFDAVVSASKNYVEHGALRGQIGITASEVTPTTAKPTGNGSNPSLRRKPRTT